MTLYCSDRVKDKLMEPCSLIQVKVADVWRYLGRHSSTISISAISMTVGRRLTICPDHSDESDALCVNVQRKQVAGLIIWSSAQRRGAWRELRDVRHILNTQLKAEVICQSGNFRGKSIQCFPNMRMIARRNIGVFG